MEILNNPQAAQKLCHLWRENGLQVGFVATMGALHDGHLSLLEQAISENDRTCASIFVNPLQFDDSQDLKNYPSNMEKDLELLDHYGCDMAFSGTMETFFPEVNHPDQIEQIDPGPCARDLEGAYRPGFFEGVATIVDRLFRTVGDCKAYFGEKDFQQTLVIKHLSSQLKITGINIEVVVCPTIRNEDGLALSSRNQHLGITQIETANQIYRALNQTQLAWRSSIRDRGTLMEILQTELKHPQIHIDYAEVRNPENWNSTEPEMADAIALVAVRIGGVRLIDNLRLNQP